MQIDAHVHFWNPSRGDYTWMPKHDPVLCRNYGPSDIAPDLAAAKIDRMILVQAAASVAETDYLLEIADGTPMVAGVVGWIDFEQATHLAQLRRLAKHPKFKGVRPMIQDIADEHWMLRDNVQWAFAAVADMGLTFDALGFPRHSTHFLKLLQCYSGLRMVVDHGMKPDIRNHSEGSFKAWAKGMEQLAKTGAWCKLSGLITEASERWCLDDLMPYTSHLLDVFGAGHLMWGSDWPVCRQRCEYGAWRKAAQQLTAALDTDEHALVFGDTAAAFYRLPAI